MPPSRSSEQPVVVIAYSDQRIAAELTAAVRATGTWLAALACDGRHGMRPPPSAPSPALTPGLLRSPPHTGGGITCTASTLASNGRLS
jgi:hypothetical protein